MVWDCRDNVLRRFDEALGPLYDIVYRIKDIIGEDINKYLDTRMIMGAPFGVMNVSISKRDEDEQNNIKIIYKDRDKIEKTWGSDISILKNKELVPFWKVALIHGNKWFNFDYGITNKPIILKPGEICTDQFVIMSAFHTEQKAKSFCNYLSTKFVRFLVSCCFDESFIYPNAFEFVPWLDFSKEYSDKDLYEMFDLEREHKYFIDMMVYECKKYNYSS